MLIQLLQMLPKDLRPWSQANQLKIRRPTKSVVLGAEGGLFGPVKTPTLPDLWGLQGQADLLSNCNEIISSFLKAFSTSPPNMEVAADSPHWQQQGWQL